MSINKKELTDIVYANMGFHRTERTKFIGDLFDIIIDKLSRDEDVKISGFGKWTVKKKESMIGRDLRTGEPIIIGAHKVVTFKCSPKVKKLLNR